MQPTLDRTSLWTRMRFLLENLERQFNGGTFAEECLDLLIELVGAQRGVLCVPTPSELWRPLTARERRRSIPTTPVDARHAAVLNDAVRSRRCVVGGIEPSGAALIAVPLRRGAWQGSSGQATTIGAFYLEVSTPELQPLHIEFLESTAVLLAVTLDQRERIEAAEEKVRAVQAHETIDEGPSLNEILSFDSMSALDADIQACIVGSSSVMILGESGTGKTRLAAALARASARTPIVRATLGASDDLNTITSELFGHERGAFSGAITKRTGLVEYADGGTLILDEVLNLPSHAQQLLLDFTQFGTYRPLGYQGKEPKTAKVRVIAATNGNIWQAIADTRFRQDLYFRLAGVIITLPPLRERRHEIPDLAQSFLARLSPATPWKLSASSRRLLLSEAWEWEGNIRQLQAVMRRARDRAVAAGMNGGVLDAHHIGEPPRYTHAPRPSPLKPSPLNASAANDCVEPQKNDSVENLWAELQVQRSSLDDRERTLIEQAMKQNRGVVSHAARQLQISRTSLLSRMATLQLDRKRYRQ